MNCSEVQLVLPEMIEGGENSEYQTHVKSCSECSELVSDLELIARESRQLAEVDEPPHRVWVKIAAELRAEGIIREQEAAPVPPVPTPAPGRRWNSWWLVPVAAALVAAGSYVIKPKPAARVAQLEAPATSTTSQQAAASSQPVAIAKKGQPAATPKGADSVGPDDHAPMMTASTADQKFLDTVSPEMRSTYEGQLRAVNSYIRDAENYLKQNPGDEDGRQHLMDAYEQKEMLYQMALDRVQ